MSFWGGLAGKAKSLLGTRPKPSMAAVKRTRMDEVVYKELLADVPVLSEVAHDLNDAHAYTGELVQDAFQLFFKDPAELMPIEQMDPRALVNHAVINTIDKLPTTPATREYTRYDKYGSAVATSALQNKLDDELRNAEEVRDATAEAAKAQEELEQAEQEAQQTAEQVEDLPPTGPLTEEQQALVDQLSKQLDACDLLAQQAQRAQQDATAQVAALQRRVRSKVAAAVDTALDQLQTEAEVFASWGIAPGKLQKMSFQERQELAQKLMGNRLNEFRRLIGRYRARAAAERARKVEYGRDEVYDTTLGDFLPDVIGTEFARLATRATRLMFLRDYSQKRLVSRKWRGVERIADGAIICMLDCSDSMMSRDAKGNTREAFGKAVALAMLDQAHAAGRDFVVINFASPWEQATWHFPAGEEIDIDELIGWAEHNFRGGTSYEEPFEQAMDILEANYNEVGKQRADLVMLTDDECQVSSEWAKGYYARKELLGFRTWGVAIGRTPGTTLQALCDDVRGVNDFDDPSVVADMHRSI